MRSVLTCAVGVAIAVLNALPAAAQTDVVNDLPKPVEQCIRDNAPAVEQAVQPLNEGVDFLVGELCAKPVAEQLAREQQANTAVAKEAIKKLCEQNSKPKSNKGSNDCENSALTLDYSAGTWLSYSPNLNKPPAATALAAQVLLRLRIQRMNATSTQGTH
jgi:hypothetical protein